MSLLDKYGKRENFDDLEPNKVSREGIEYYNICSVIDYMFGEEFYTEIYPEIGWEGEEKLLKEMIRKFEEEKDGTYWAAPNEDFFVWRAINHAKEENKSAVIGENLS